MNVCIATPDMLGPVKNGGVGTAFMGLLEALRSNGHKVTVLYTSTQYDTGSPEHWKEDFRRRHDVEFIPYADLPNASARFAPLQGADEYLYRSYRVYKYLCSRPDFDVIHFPDYLGIGYYTLMAKAIGLAFTKVPIIVTTHGPVAWSRASGYATAKDLKPMVSGVLEKFVVEQADMVISPSQFLIDWFTAHGWNLPKETHHAFNNLPEERKPDTAASSKKASAKRRPPVKELVFFGRIEQRKGIYLFIDAINELLDTQPESLETIRITFMGKFNQASISRSTFGLRLKKWPMPWQCVEGFDADQALEYLSEPGRLAVIPSLMDNSPCTVVECLERGIEFVATAVGGIPELVREKDQLPIAQAHALAEALSAHLVAKKRPKPLSLAINKKASIRLLVNLHEKALKKAATPTPRKLPKISVCLLHRDRPEYLRQAMEGFSQQTYGNFEVIIADNGSTKPEAIKLLKRLETEDQGFPVKVDRIGYNAFPGPARNHAATLATGDVLKFHDDDNISKPDELSIFANAIAQGFDIVTCGLDFFIDDPASSVGNKPPLMFLGAAGGLTALTNIIGDTNFAIRKSAFDAVEGFTDCGFLYHAEDWLLLAKAQAAGLKIGTVPEPIVWYRDEANRYNTNWRKQDIDGARFRVGQALASTLPEHAAQIVTSVAGVYHHHRRPQHSPPATAANANGAAGTESSDAPDTHDVSDLLDRYWIVSQIPTSKSIRAFGLRSIVGTKPDALTMPWKDLLTVAKSIDLQVPGTFDEAAYLDNNPDVASAVESGEFRNGYSHYIRFGRSEGRPRPMNGKVTFN